MAQKINTTIKGAYYYETEPGSWSDWQTYGNIVGDNAHNFALAKDGDYSGITIDHSGGGNGCLLGYSLMREVKQNYWIRTVTYDTVIWAAPVFIPAGETAIFVQLFTSSPLTHSAQVFSALSGAGPILPTTATAMGPKVGMSRSNSSPYDGILEVGCQTGSNPSGQLAFVVISAEANNDIVYNQYNAILIHFNRERQNTDGLMTVIGGSGSEYKLLTDAVVEADGTAIVNAEQVIDTAFVNEDEPINGFVINRMNKQQNALTEYLTGSPVASNASLTLADSSTPTAPDRSAFYNHAEGFNNGYPYIQIPLGGSGLGGFDLDWTGFEDSPGAMPIGPTAAGAQTVKLQDEIVYIPDMLLGGATSRARCTLALICTQNTSPSCVVTMKARSVNSSGSTSTQETQAISVSGIGIYWVTIDPVRLWRDRFNRLEIHMEVDANFKSAPGGSPHLPSISLAGYCLYSV